MSIDIIPNMEKHIHWEEKWISSIRPRTDHEKVQAISKKQRKKRQMID